MWKFLGNAVKTLNEPNLGVIFLGIILGLAVGTIPLNIPGMSAPVRLGIAGGPIVMGILIGALGPRVHFISYMTRSAGLMLRELGLALYLACLGLEAGGQFFETVVRPERSDAGRHRLPHHTGSCCHCRFHHSENHEV